MLAKENFKYFIRLAHMTIQKHNKKHIALLKTRIHVEVWMQ